MPWTMNDYPSSLKNFNKTITKKAIDIANALVDEGYDESRAIPIATKQAKEWYDNASHQEREDYVKNAHPTKRSSDKQSRPELLDKPEMVIPHDKQWAVKAQNAKKPAKFFDNKTDAISYGKAIAQNKRNKLIIQRQDKSEEKTFDFR